MREDGSGFILWYPRSLRRDLRKVWLRGRVLW